MFCLYFNPYLDVLLKHQKLKVNVTTDEKKNCYLSLMNVSIIVREILLKVSATTVIY